MKKRICYKCGTEIKEDELECSNCGMSVEENKKASILTVISVILIYIMPKIAADNFPNFIKSIIGLSEIAGFTLLIYVRIKFPKHLGSKVLLISYLLIMALGLICCVVLLTACISNF